LEQYYKLFRYFADYSAGFSDAVVMFYKISGSGK